LLKCQFQGLDYKFTIFIFTNERAEFPNAQNNSAELFRSVHSFPNEHAPGRRPSRQNWFRINWIVQKVYKTLKHGRTGKGFDWEKKWSEQRCSWRAGTVRDTLEKYSLKNLKADVIYFF